MRLPFSTTSWQSSIADPDSEEERFVTTGAERRTYEG
jgi:hypothetical protein